MCGSLLKLVMLSGAFLVAVPPGACCVEFASADPVSTAGACCRHAAPLSEHGSKPVQTDPRECCCRYDAVPRGEQVSLADCDALLVPAVSFDRHGSNVEATGRMPAPEEMDSGPPRHLLQCVWLC